MWFLYLHRNTGSGDGSGGVVLGGEDVAAGPGNLSTKGNEGLNEDSSLDGHVKTTSNAGTGERLVSGVSATDGHQTGHLNLGELDLAATEGGQGLEDGQQSEHDSIFGTLETRTMSATLNW